MSDPDLPDAEFDALSALAPLLRVRPELQSLCRFGDRWASPHAHEAPGWAPFHLVSSGSCVLVVDGDAPLVLQAGDVVLLPHGDAHVMRSGRRGATRGLPQVRRVATRAIEVKSNSDRPETELICGRLTFDQPHDNLARAALPRVIRVSMSQDAGVARLRMLLVAIRDELDAAAPGASAIACDLASALLVMVLRTHFHRHAGEGILKLLGERHTARALAAMMQDPAHNWCLDEIAACARTSRATLVRDFRRLVDATPFGVLAEVRFGIARHSLTRSDRTLADIAIEAGYRSQSAFSRAFQRRFGIAPGAMRQASSPRRPQT